MDALVLSGIVLTLLLLSLVLSKKNKLYADRFLILYLAFAIIHQLHFYATITGLLHDSIWLLLAKGGYLLQAPLFFLYVSALTRSGRLSSAYILCLLAPFIAYSLTFFYYFFWGFEGHQVAIQNEWLYIDQQLSIPWAGFAVIFLLIEPFFLIWFYFLLRDYKKRIHNSLSNTEHINLKWLNMLLFSWFVLAVVLVPMSLLSVGSDGVPIHLLEIYVALGYMIFILVMGYYGFKQTTIFSDLELTEAVSEGAASSGAPSYERSGLSVEQASLYHEKLLDLMKEKKPYLNGELRARDLASELGISVNYLSQILNEKQKQNFFDFVNSYRVLEAQEKMQNPAFRQFTLLAIALDSGFNSKTSFNITFKKVTQQTPSQYYRSVVKK